jgi:hypothetical protein
VPPGVAQRISAVARHGAVDGAALGKSVGRLDGRSVGLMVGGPVGFNGAVLGKSVVGCGDGRIVGSMVDGLVGLRVGFGVGHLEGLSVGCEIGLRVGFGVGHLEGLSVGRVVGFCVGFGVGHLEGLSVGRVVGFCVGLSVFLVGALDGMVVGVLESSDVGVSVKFPFSGSFTMKERVSASIQLVIPSVVVTFDKLIYESMAWIAPLDIESLPGQVSPIGRKSSSTRLLEWCRQRQATLLVQLQERSFREGRLLTHPCSLSLRR